MKKFDSVGNLMPHFAIPVTGIVTADFQLRTSTFARKIKLALINRKTWNQHRTWAFVASFLSLASLVAYIWECYRLQAWPTGSSPVCFTLGVIAGLIFVFEFLLWIRKKLRTWRIFGPAFIWMKAHIWLGLATIPIVFFHCGFFFGGPLTIVLMSLYGIVMVSGIVGLILQNYIPTRLVESVEFETIYSQIDRIVCHIREDAEHLMKQFDRAFKFPPMDSKFDLLAQAFEEEKQNREVFSVEGAKRAAGHVHGRVMKLQSGSSKTVRSEQLNDFVMEFVEPYLQPNCAKSEPLRDAKRSAVMFDNLRSNCDNALSETIDTIQTLCEQRRQLSRQARLHGWLHGWLFLHLPLSVSLMLFLIVHIWLAILYW